MHNKIKFVKIVLVIFFLVALESILVIILLNGPGPDLVSTSLEKDRIEYNALKDINLKLDDLVEGYELDHNNTFSDEVEEIYYAKYFYNGSDQKNYTNINICLYKPHEEEAMVDRVASVEEMLDIYYEMYNHIYEEIPIKIGDESYIATIDFTNSTKDSITPGISTLIAFNVGDVTCHLNWGSENFDYIFDLAKIVEQRIYDYIDNSWWIKDKEKKERGGDVGWDEEERVNLKT